jgi:hypothetical protein
MCPLGHLNAAAVETMIANSHAECDCRTGNRFEDHHVQVVTYRVELIVPSTKVAYAELAAGRSGFVEPDHRIELRYVEGDVSWAGEFGLRDSAPGACSEGPSSSVKTRRPQTCRSAMSRPLGALASW